MPSDPQASFAAASLASKVISEKVLPVSTPAPAANAKPQSQHADKKSAGSFKIWIFTVAVVVIAAGMFWALHSTGGNGAGEGTPEATLPLETFIVNLEGPGQRAYLRIGITLGLSNPVTRNSKEDVPIAAARDAILSVLATAKAEELLTADGKDRLKADLLRVLDARAPQLGVRNVYFTEFLVQM